MSTTWSGVQAPGGFSLRPRLVMPVKVEPGISRCARDARALLVAQAVRQRLGQHLHAGLADIVGGVARRAGDALLGAGIDDRAGRLLRQHGRREGLHAVDDAPQVDVEHAPPALDVVPRTAAWRGAGIVHQHAPLRRRSRRPCPSAPARSRGG